MKLKGTIFFILNYTVLLHSSVYGTTRMSFIFLAIKGILCIEKLLLILFLNKY
jgi:hypothetical protein